jgi:tetratricopeptide (TPR) repeat protein
MLASLASSGIEAQRPAVGGDMAKLFLSYSRKEARKAQYLTEWLEREGHEVWRDEDDISGGASFSSEIEKALEESDAVLVLWSAASVQSAWVRDEAGFARDSGKLIPFSLDGTEAPLGFRQFQSISLAKWKGRGEPPGSERIRGAIERISRNVASGSYSARAHEIVRDDKSRSLHQRVFAVAAFLLGVVGITGAILWHRSAGSPGITIAVLASPKASDQGLATDYADVTAADMAAFLPTRFDGATVIAPADAGRASGYRMLISANHHGIGSDASITLSDRDGHTIIWSKSWSVRDASVVDLPQEVSRSASQAALCLTDARSSAKPIDQPALGLYVSGCVGIGDPSWSDDQLLATFNRVVKLAPDFAKAWASLAVGRAIYAEGQQDRSGKADAAALRSARDAIATARKLNPHEGLSYLAEWHLVQSDPLQGLRVLDRAVELAPDEPLLHARRADSLAAVGRMADSVEEARRAVELDPLSSFARSQYIVTLTYAGDLSRAKAEIAEARKKWPNNIDIDWADYGFEYRYGDPKVAEKLMPRVLDYSDADMAPNLKLLVARLDPSSAKIDDAIGAFRTRWGSDPRTESKILLALGTFGKVNEIYELLGNPKYQPFIEQSILFRPEFGPVRADPRFMEVAARLGLVRYWRESGNWPDFCTSEQLKYDCKTEAAKYR